MPVAVLGLVNFVVMRRSTHRGPGGRSSTGSTCCASSGASAPWRFVLWLVAAELLIIDHICLWCTGVHVVTFLLLLVLITRESHATGLELSSAGVRRSSSFSPPQMPCDSWRSSALARQSSRTAHPRRSAWPSARARFAPPCARSRPAERRARPRYHGRRRLRPRQRNYRHAPPPGLA